MKTTLKKVTTKDIPLPAEATADGGESVDSILDSLAEIAGQEGTGRIKPLPMWPDIGKKTNKIPRGIAVFRLDPPDGYLGEFPPDSDLERLKQLVGGRVLDLQLKDVEGRVMPGGRQSVTIHADPVLTATARAAAQSGGGSPLDAIARNLDPVKQLFELQGKQVAAQQQAIRDDLERHKQEAKTERDQRNQEIEAQLVREREAAKQREEEKDAKHKRELELERERIRERQDEAKRERESQSARDKEWIALQQANQANQTQLMIAAMNNSKTDLTVFTSMFDKVIGAMQNSNDQDPAVAAFQTMGKGLESLATIATSKNGQQANPGKVQLTPGAKQMIMALPEGKRAKVIAALTEDDASTKKNGEGGADKKSRVTAKVTKLMQTMIQRGVDPEQMLDEAIKHYESDAGAVDEDDDDDDNAADGKRSKPAAGNGTPSVARRERAKHARTNQPAVVKRPTSERGSAPTSSARSAGPKVVNSAARTPKAR